MFPTCYLYHMYEAQIQIIVDCVVHVSSLVGTLPLPNPELPSALLNEMRLTSHRPAVSSPHTHTHICSTSDYTLLS